MEAPTTTTPPVRDSIPLDELAVIMDRLWKRMVSCRMSRICKHYAAGFILSEMETLGIAPPPEIIKAVVFAWDEEALEWERGAPVPNVPAAA